LPAEEIERDLAQHRPEWTPKQRGLAARLANGAIGAARSFDLAGYTAARTQALTILNTALRGTEHTELFKMTETYRAGADGREKLERLLRTLYSLLQDLTFLNSSTPELVRNTDIQSDLKKLSEVADFDWIALAADRLNDVERGMRRNLLRSLSLDAFATALERSS
jgi:DNA polymerase III subunit delta'